MMFGRKFKMFRRIVMTIVLVAFVSTLIFLAAPTVARAQITIVADLPAETNKISTMIKTLLKGVLTQAVFNLLNYVSQKLAHDAAVWIASGGKGQGTLFESRGWGQYMKDTALNGVGEALGTFDQFGMLGGFSLCDPSLPEFGAEFSISMQIGLIETYEPQPKCRWNEIAANWDEFASSMSSPELFSNFTAGLVPGEGGIESMISFNLLTDERRKEKEEQARFARLEGRGFKPVVGISGNIKSPVSMVEEQLKQSVLDKPQQTQEQQAQGLFTNSDSIITMGLNMGSMFLNTLASALFKRISSGLFDTTVSEVVHLTRPELDVGPPGGGREAALSLFADLLTPRLIEGGKYNPLNDFVACPEERGINNCVMDMGFLQAVEQANAGEPITVAEAIKSGLLNGNWPLISDKDPLNQENSCYTKGYCYSNLVKLRKMRIIPIGWELAAKISPFGKPITLAEAVNKFNDCPTINGVFNPNGNFSTYLYCHLIDPNWIVKMPSTECKTQAYGPRLIASGMSEREKICVDVASCVEEDGNGKCVGPYSYCTKDKHIWRIKGDACPSEYSSCQTLNTRQNKKVSYLLNTVDYGTCDENNVGCKWYSYEKEIAPQVDRWLPEKRIYADKDVRACPADSVGCSELIRVKDGVSINLLQNPSFEKDDALSDWKVGLRGTINESRGGANSLDGETAVKINSGARIGQGLAEVDRDGYYSLSYYARKSGDAEGTVKGILFFFGEHNLSLDVPNIETNCRRNVANKSLELEVSPADFYERENCYFKAPSNAVVILLGFEGNNVWLDAVQLEEGRSANEFRTNSYPSSADLDYYKVAPEYLGCDSDNPHQDCQNYAAFCKADEVGCELYRSTTEDFEVPAIIANEDRCSAGCNGYDTFKQEETNFESSKNNIYLIPQNSKTCESTAAGCDEFTNVATEGVKYFSYLRPCMEPGSDAATYYTWEGSDTVGYQLKTWNLKKGMPQGDETTGSNPPAYISGFNDYVQCAKEIFQNGTNPDCREFYDALGNISYRLYSKTIVATNECKTYRKTESAEAGCSAFGGEWRENKCFYNGYDAESATCEAKFSGCRAYTGAASRNIRNLFIDTFESGTDDGWEKSVAAVSLENSSESLYVGGHSLKGFNSSPQVSFQKNIKDYITKGKTYFVSFWAKASPINPDTKISSVRIKIGNDAFNFGGVRLSAQWQPYTLGPLLVEAELIDDAFLEFNSNYNTIFIDNIALKEISDSIYLIKNSWTIPASCDMTAEGVLLPGAMLGCKEYKNTKGVLYYLKSFKNLCREAAVGCEEFIDKKNNESLGITLYNASCDRDDSFECGDSSCADITKDAPCGGGPPKCTIRAGEQNCYFNYDGDLPSGYKDENTIVIPADEREYLVANDRAKCSAENMGCAAVGEPKEGVCVLHRSDIDRASRATKSGTFPPQTFCVDFNNCYCYENESDTAKLQGEALCLVKKDESTCKFKAKKYFDASDFYASNLGRKSLEFENKSLILKSSEFSNILCKSAEDRCESWTKLDEQKRQSTLYFKDPVGGVCEYKDKVRVAGVEKSGWFKEGTEVPCYVNYESAGVYGIWKNGDTDFKGWAGKCLDQFSTCTTIEDPQTKEAYYFKRNKLLDETSCNGLVSPKKGCVLFRDINDPRLLWNAFATYAEVNMADGKLVSPSSSERFGIDIMHGIDSNLILKVQRDRACDEWLDCKSTETVWDENEGIYKSVCIELGICREYVKLGDKYICQKFVKHDNSVSPILNKAEYQKRNTTYISPDYSGYAVPERIHIDSQLAVTDFDSTRTELGEEFGECRAYPEEDSPFPSAVASWNFMLDNSTSGGLAGKKQKFENATICEKSLWYDLDGDFNVDRGELRELEPCDCRYQKATYGTYNVKYFPLLEDGVPDGYCSDGRVGLPCNPFDADSCSLKGGVVKGTCQKLTKIEKYIGFEGDCLERDESLKKDGQDSAPCLTWMPVHFSSVSNIDIYNLYASAGYNPPVRQGSFYCIDQSSSYFYGRGEYTKFALETCEALSECPQALFGERIADENYHRLIADVGDGGAPDTKSHEEMFVPVRYLFRDVRTDFGGTNQLTFEEFSFPEHEVSAIVIHPVEQDWASDIVRNKQNIMSRKGRAGRFEHNGKWYTYWEIRHPENDIGDLPAGVETARSSTPLFVSPTDFDSFKDYTDIRRIGTWRKCGAPNKGDYIAIRALFDENEGNRFLGLWTSYCEGATDHGGIFAKVEIRFAPYCTKLVEVKTPKLFGGDKAFTNRKELTTVPYATYVQEPLPFGSAIGYPLPRPGINTGIPWYIPQHKCLSSSNSSLCGSPYVSSEYFHYYNDAGAGGTLYYKYPYPDVDTNDITPLNLLFARVFNVYEWDNDDRYYKNIACLNQDITSDGKLSYWCTEGTYRLSPQFAPRIYGVPSSAADDPIIDTMTINGKTGKDGNPREGKGGLLKTAMQFYGRASAEQMPISEIQINWGDGGNNVLKGKYKNYKKNCAGDDFGNSPDACHEGYFEFTHVYICATADLLGDTGLPECSDTVIPSNKLACKRRMPNGKTACVFRPRVMLKDNWGWCNFTNNKGLYEKEYGEDCKFNNDSVRSSAGTPFAGEIIVYPE